MVRVYRLVGKSFFGAAMSPSTVDISVVTIKPT